jgi:hypothetical protein
VEERAGRGGLLNIAFALFKESNIKSYLLSPTLSSIKSNGGEGGKE